MKPNLLRTAVVIFIFSFSFLVSRAQWVSIPDTAFVSFLRTTYPACMSGIQMDTTCPAIINSRGVYCDHRPIFNLTGLQYFDRLDTLKCFDDSLIFLPPLPKTIRYMACDGNKLTSLPALPDSLRWLSCGSNELTTLPSLPAELRDLL